MPDTRSHSRTYPQLQTSAATCLRPPHRPTPSCTAAPHIVARQQQLAPHLSLAHRQQQQLAPHLPLAHRQQVGSVDALPAHSAQVERVKAHLLEQQHCLLVCKAREVLLAQQLALDLGERNVSCRGGGEGRGQGAALRGDSMRGGMGRALHKAA
eukprot:133633-Chlamydomonas_euryale.AAC.4